MGYINSSDKKKCPICGALDVELWRKEYNAPFDVYECSECGCFFMVNSHIADDFKIDKEKLKCYLFYHQSDLRPVICDKEYFGKYNKEDCVDVYNLTPEMVENWYPKTFADKIDLILLKLAELSAFDGDYINIGTIHNRLFFAVNKKSKGITEGSEKNIQADFVQEFMEKQEYIKNLGSGFIQLTAKALDKIYELQKSQTNNKNVFVAMKFGKETESLRKKIKEGLDGFNIRIMDEIEHNHQIVPEMLYEIRNSRFVIAELSHHNNGAYYEAGYALGLGKEVIHICNKKELESGLHFDVAQVNTIFYDSIDEIPEKLKKRIQATIRTKL